MKTGVRLVKDEEKVNDLRSYAMKTNNKASFPSSNIGAQTFFSCSFSNRRDRKGIANETRSARVPENAYFSTYFSSGVEFIICDKKTPR